MEENVTQINGGIMTNVDVSVRNVMYVKKIMFGILLHVQLWRSKYSASIVDDSAIICDEFIDADSDGKANLNAETNFNEKSNL